MKVPRVLFVLLSACASVAEPAPGPPISPTKRLVRTHESRPADETAESTSACGDGDLPMCHAAALDAYYAPPSPETDARAKNLFERACNGGYAPSCNGLGVLYDQGRGVAKDHKMAVDLYRRACLGNASTGCEHLAGALRDGRGIPKDLVLAERAAARAKCLLDFTRDSGACTSLDHDGPLSHASTSGRRSPLRIQRRESPRAA